MLKESFKIASKIAVVTQNDTPGASAPATPEIPANANRVRIRFVSQLNEQSGISVHGCGIYVAGYGANMLVGSLNYANPVVELSFEEHGALVYGPFFYVDDSAQGQTVTAISFNITERVLE